MRKKWFDIPAVQTAVQPTKKIFCAPRCESAAFNHLPHWPCVTQEAQTSGEDKLEGSIMPSMHRHCSIYRHIVFHFTCFSPLLTFDLSCLAAGPTLCLHIASTFHPPSTLFSHSPSLFLACSGQRAWLRRTVWSPVNKDTHQSVFYGKYRQTTCIGNLVLILAINLT